MPRPPGKNGAARGLHSASQPEEVVPHDTASLPKPFALGNENPPQSAPVPRTSGTRKPARWPRRRYSKEERERRRNHRRWLRDVEARTDVVRKRAGELEAILADRPKRPEGRHFRAKGRRGPKVHDIAWMEPLTLAWGCPCTLFNELLMLELGEILLGIREARGDWPEMLHIHGFRRDATGAWR